MHVMQVFMIMVQMPLTNMQMQFFMHVIANVYDCGVDVFDEYANANFYAYDASVYDCSINQLFEILSLKHHFSLIISFRF